MRNINYGCLGGYPLPDIDRVVRLGAISSPATGGKSEYNSQSVDSIYFPGWENVNGKRWNLHLVGHLLF